MQSTKIIVYTCLTNGKDNLIDQTIPAKYVAYLGESWFSNTWEIQKCPEIFKSPRRNSRVMKMLAHQIDCEYSIYLDANMKLLVSPEELIETYLKDHDIAVFKHPVRNCIYEEAKVCALARLDDPEAIISQVKRYEDNGYAKDKGLCECGVIIRRHTPKVEQLNNAWFAEYSMGCVRDQISFMYAVDKVGIRVNVIDIPYQKDLTRGFIKLCNHLTPRNDENIATLQ